MKIAYVFHRDAANPAVQSGRPASVLNGLENLGVEVERIFPLGSRLSRSSTAKKILYRAVGRYHRGDRDQSYLAAMADEFSTRTRGVAYDAVFSPGSEAVSLLTTDRPITFCADATFANMLDYYWDFTRLSAEFIRKAHRQEANAISRATLAIYPSEWAAQAAVQFYGAPADRVRVIPFGANLGGKNTRSQATAWIAARGRDELRLLFVGRHWERKGGEIVVAAAQRLALMGLPVRLDVVGCEVPPMHAGNQWITAHGLLSPRVPEQRAALEALFARAHFVFVPSRAEAYGMTFAEANAFGVPAVAAATGGIPSIIRSGGNGILLPLEAEAVDYADAIARVYSRESDYLAMCGRAFAEYESRLNWRVFCSEYVGALRRITGVDERQEVAA